MSIDPEMVAHFPELGVQAANEMLLRTYPVPLKAGGSKDLITVNWRLNLIAEKGTEALLVGEGATVPEEAKTKVFNALAYAKQVVNGGKAYFDDAGQLPVELKAFWVGATQPPFKHGDGY